MKLYTQDIANKYKHFLCDVATYLTWVTRALRWSKVGIDPSSILSWSVMVSTVSRTVRMSPAKRSLTWLAAYRDMSFEMWTSDGLL